MTPFSFSELSTLRQCSHKWDLRYRQKWRPPTTAPALVRGTRWHEILAANYSGRLDDINQIVQSVEDEQERDLLAWMARGYLDKYSSTVDEDWTVLEVELRGSLPIYDSGWELSFVLDLLIEDELGVWVVEHKSTGQLSSNKDLDFADQATLYAWAARELGYDVTGVVWSEALTRKNKVKPQPLKSRFRRTRLHRSDLECRTALSEAIRTMEVGHEWVDSAPRSPDPEKCSRCEFREPCLMGRRGGDEKRELLSAGFTQKARLHIVDKQSTM